MIKHTKTIFWQIADEFFEFVWPFSGVGAFRVKRILSELIYFYLLRFSDDFRVIEVNELA